MKGNRMKYYPKVYLKRLKDQLVEHAQREASIHFRRNALERQKASNYNNEYDRIRGILHHSTLPAETGGRLENRKAELRELGARALTIQ